MPEASSKIRVTRIPFCHVPLAGAAVALKLLRRDLVLRTTFLREFCVGRCVSSHPGLLQTLAEPLQTSRHFAFAQEYAPCGDLSGMLQEQVRQVGAKFGTTYPKSNPIPNLIPVSNPDPKAVPNRAPPEAPNGLLISNSTVIPWLTLTLTHPTTQTPAWMGRELELELRLD